jgi:hypothetical protein
MVFDVDFTLMMKKDQLKCKNESFVGRSRNAQSWFNHK